MDINRHDSTMLPIPTAEGTAKDWDDLLCYVLLLQEQPVRVEITEGVEVIAMMRGHLARTTSADKSGDDNLLLWTGFSLPNCAFAIAREFVHSWSWVEDEERSELRIRHGATAIRIDFRPGAAEA